MERLFERFLQERKYLQNVSPTTIQWHTQSLKWLAIEQPTDADLRDFVLRMREAGLKASSCNCRIRSVNAYLRWSGSVLRAPKLIEDEYIPATYSLKQISQLAAWEAKGFYARRLHLLVLTLLDTGTRLGEVFIAANPKLSARTLSKQLAEIGIKRGRNWVMDHRPA